MEDRKLLAQQQRQIKALQQERDAALEALSRISAQGAFSNFSRGQAAQDFLLGDICARANQIITFKATAIYFVDENTQDLALVFLDSKDTDSRQLEKEVQKLMKDQTFAVAIQDEEPIHYLNSGEFNHLVVHVLATSTRVYGVFVGLLAENNESILNITRKLFSAAMRTFAHALENFKIQELMREKNLGLERQVALQAQELQELSERLQITIDGMQAGVILVESETRKVVHANRMALDMIGASKDEVVGKQSFKFVCFSNQDNYSIVEDNLKANNYECVLNTKDGRGVSVLKSVSRVKIDNKEHLVESFVDISQQKKLATLREDVDRIMRHDLKTPLNGIIGLPDIMLMDEGLSSTHREYLEHIKSSGYKLLNMINVSLDLYKMEAGTYEYNPSSNDLIAPILSVLSDLMERVVSKKLTVTFYLDEQEVTDSVQFKILCEELLLYTMLSNLLINAFDASPSGERVSIKIQRLSDEFVLSIHNQGVIPEQIRESFFEKYVTVGKIGGTGFGTYFARLIVETMGGTIQFTTSEEEGTTIFATIPLRA